MHRATSTEKDNLQLFSIFGTNKRKAKVFIVIYHYDACEILF